MQASSVTREFTFNGVKLPDPDPKLSPEEVRAVLATMYECRDADPCIAMYIRETARKDGIRAAVEEPDIALPVRDRGCIIPCTEVAE
jgi:hypothetical protein